MAEGDQKKGGGEDGAPRNPLQKKGEKEKETKGKKEKITTRAHLRRVAKAGNSDDLHLRMSVEGGGSSFFRVFCLASWFFLVLSLSLSLSLFLFGFGSRVLSHSLPSDREASGGGRRLEGP